MTSERLQKVTSRGQIEIRPARLQKDNDEITVFDAIRDNKGKGIRAKNLLKILTSSTDHWTA